MERPADVELFLEYDVDVANEYRDRYGRDLSFLSFSDLPNEDAYSLWKLREIDHAIRSIKKEYYIVAEILFVVSLIHKDWWSATHRQVGMPSAMLLPDGRYVIIVPERYIYRLRLLFIHVCSDRNFSSLMGLSTSNLIGPLLVEGRPRALTRDEPGSPPVSIVLLDEENFAAGAQNLVCAEVLATLALRGLVSHELGHIRNGHFLLDRKQVIISEDVGGASSDIAISLALEFDADAFACNMTFAYLHRMVGKPLKPMRFASEEGNPENYDLIVKSEQEAIIYSAITMYGLYRFFDTRAEGVAAVGIHRHPPQIVRATTAALHFKAHAEPLNIRFPNGYEHDVVKVAIEAVEAALPVLPGEPRATLDLEKVADLMDQHMAVISPAWNAIRDDLERLKLGGNIAPRH